MPRPATFDELKELLRDPQFRARVCEPAQAQLSIPTDGKGLRIRVSVRPESALELPETMTVRLGEEDVSVALEQRDDFEEVELL